MLVHDLRVHAVSGKYIATIVVDGHGFVGNLREGTTS